MKTISFIWDWGGCKFVIAPLFQEKGGAPAPLHPLATGLVLTFIGYNLTANRQTSKVIRKQVFKIKLTIILMLNLDYPLLIC